MTVSVTDTPVHGEVLDLAPAIEAFRVWVVAGCVADHLEVRVPGTGPALWPVRAVLFDLWYCTTPLPVAVADKLGLRRSVSHGDAVRVLWRMGAGDRSVEHGLGMAARGLIVASRLVHGRHHVDGGSVMQGCHGWVGPCPDVLPR